MGRGSQYLPGKRAARPPGGSLHYWPDTWPVWCWAPRTWKPCYTFQSGRAAGHPLRSGCWGAGRTGGPAGPAGQLMRTKQCRTSGSHCSRRSGRTSPTGPCKQSGSSHFCWTWSVVIFSSWEAESPQRGRLPRRFHTGRRGLWLHGHPDSPWQAGLCSTVRQTGGDTQEDKAWGDRKRADWQHNYWCYCEEEILSLQPPNVQWKCL